MNKYTCVQLRIPSISCPFLKYLCLCVTCTFYRCCIIKFRGHKNSICIQLHVTFSYSRPFKNLIILPQCYLGSMPLAAFSSRVTRLIRCLGLIWFPFNFDNHLRACLLFKFILLLHIYVGYTNMSFCEWLSFNPLVVLLYILL